MGAGKLIDTSNPNVRKYVLRIGEVITLLSYLDYNIQVFIEAVLNLDSEYKAKSSVISLTRSLGLSKRVEFLKSLIKEKHNKAHKNYIVLYKEIKECNEIRNTFAHSQVFFHNDKIGSIMMISNLKKIDVQSPRTFFSQVTIKELDGHIKRFRELINKFNSFIYRLGYFQGHRVE